MNIFPDNARVCFLGDSITANGRFVALIHDCFKRNHPHCGIRFFDCGTSGGSAEWLLRTFDEDIAPHKPTHVFLMIGINDSRRDLLAQPRTCERYEALKAAFDTWQTNVRELVRRCKALGAQVTLVSLPPYAEYQSGDSPVLPGAFALTVGYAAATKAMALELDCGFADVHGYLTQKMQAEDIYAEDRVHPLPKGHGYIAEAILMSRGMPMDGDPMAPHIERLTQKISDFRSLWAVEYMLIEDDSLTNEERLSFMEDFVANETWNDPKYPDGPRPYFATISRKYLALKPRHAELAGELDELLTV